MSTDVYFDDVVIGAEMRSEEHVVNAADIGSFCDPHTRPPSAAHRRGLCAIARLSGRHRARPVRPRVMEGLKTALKIYQNSSVASLGWDQVRFLRPVVAGDVVHVVFQFTDKRLSQRGGRGVVTEALQLVNQRGERVIEAVHVALVACRPAAGIA